MGLQDASLSSSLTHFPWAPKFRVLAQLVQQELAGGPWEQKTLGFWSWGPPLPPGPQTAVTF